MRRILTTNRIWSVWNRSKSAKTGDPAEAAGIIKRVNRENKLLYGELLEGKRPRRCSVPPSVGADETVNFSSIKSDIADDIRMVNVIEETGQMPKLNVPIKNPRKRAPKKDSRVQETVASDSSNADVKNVGKGSHWPHSAENLSLLNVDEKTILTFPFINSEKEIYVTNAGSKMDPIKKLVDYHSDYASVSVILGGSMSEASEANLERWKTNLVTKLGPEGFEAYNKNQMQFGCTFRSIILQHLEGVPEKKLKITSEYVNIWQSVKPVFPIFPSIVETGGLVAHEYLKYKGLFDCLAVFRDEVMLVGWKKSDKFVPSLDRAFDIPIALAAYMGALNFDDRYPFRVEQALLVMAYTDGKKADVFFLNRDKCLYYWQQWLQRLNTYRLRLQEANIAFVPARPADASMIDIEEELKSTKRTETISKWDTSEKELTVKQDTIVAGTEKINVDNELKSKVEAKHIVESQSDDESVVVNAGSILDCPLYNSEKHDYYPPDQLIAVKSSDVFEKCSYPSVTSILSETKSESAKFVLERWKHKMVAELGVEGFDKYQKDLLAMGTAMHDLIRKKILGETVTARTVPEELSGCWQSLQPVFPLFSNIHTTESPIVHPLLKYRGIIDCVAQFRNKLVIIDWKRSDKLKTTINMTYDAPLQVVAYVGAVNFDSNYPYKVEEALLVIAYADGTKADIFHLSKDKCWKYWNLWLERLNKYRTMAYEDGSKITY